MYVRPLTAAEITCLAGSTGSPEYRAFLAALRDAWEALMVLRGVSPVPLDVVSIYVEDLLRPFPYPQKQAEYAAALSAYQTALETLRASGGDGCPALWNGPWRFGTLCEDGNWRPESSPDGQPIPRNMWMPYWGPRPPSWPGP